MTMLTKYEKYRRKCVKLRNHAISKDETRPQLQGVYNSPEIKRSVSCNGYAMFVSKTLYFPELDGKIIDLDLQVIAREFPRVINIIPKKFQFEAKCQLDAVKYSYRKKPVERYLFFKLDNDTLICSREKIENPDFVVDCEWLKYLCDGSTYKVYWNTNEDPIIFDMETTTDQKMHDYLLVMPVRK